MSKSMPVERHRERLKNMQSSLIIANGQRDRAIARAMMIEGECEFLLRQITEAERRGKTEFDADRYLVKRAKKDAAE